MSTRSVISRAGANEGEFLGRYVHSDGMPSSRGPLLIQMLKKEFGAVEFDDNGNIGKRYRRQDEIGTPYCVTIDFDTLEKGDVTVRDRDSGKQERIKIEELKNKLQNSIDNTQH